jgi:hypothetical protein
MKTQNHDAIVLSSLSEREAQTQLAALLKSTPLPDDELLPNLGLYLTSKGFSRLLFFYEIYQKILHTHGIIAEFGVRWGQTLSAMAALRGIFEPFIRHRKIVGFDTFAGFRGISDKDGTRCQNTDGSFSVGAGYERHLDQVLALQEALNPIGHLKKYELVKGDACETIPRYLKDHPETIISLAIFDFDIYQPTKVALQAIKPHLCRGSILVFDELCDDYYPGETVALNEVFGLNNCRIKRLPMTARISYMEFE